MRAFWRWAAAGRGPAFAAFVSRQYRVPATQFQAPTDSILIRTPWRLAGRLLVRDLRSGEVLVLLAALVVAVAAMSAVTFFTDRVRAAVAQQAGEALAADLRIESIAPLPPEIRAAAERHGLATADVVFFRSG
jgi:predicted lysophospholipase L1 biosynthesis ABC-type transport system permease subunit